MSPAVTMSPPQSTTWSPLAASTVPMATTTPSSTAMSPGCRAPRSTVRGPAISASGQSDVLRPDRDACKLEAGGVANGRHDGGRRGDGRSLADTLCAKGCTRLGLFDQRHDPYHRHVERSGDEVIGERRVSHESTLDQDLLHHRQADALGDATLDLPYDLDGVQHLADILGRGDLDNAHKTEIDVDVDDCAMGCEGE